MKSNNNSVCASKRNNYIDIAKVVCALMVLFLHTINLNVPYDNALINTIAVSLHKITWAVNPVEFFFIISSFFLFSKPLKKEILFKYLKRLTILYFFWSVLYIGNIVELFQNVNSASDAVFAIVKMLRRVFLIGTAGHMWYVLSLVYGLLLLYPLLLKNKVKAAVVISVLLYVINLIGDPYYHFLDSISVLQKGLNLINSVFGSMYLLRGPLFIMGGFFLAKHKNFSGNIKTVFLWIFVAVITNVELFLLKLFDTGLQYSVTFFKPFAAIIFALIILSIPAKSEKNTNVLAKYSTVLYFSHIFVRDLLMNLFQNMFIIWLLTALLCIILLFVLYFIEKKLKWNWLKYIY